MLIESEVHLSILKVKIKSTSRAQFQLSTSNEDQGY